MKYPKLVIVPAKPKVDSNTVTVNESKLLPKSKDFLQDLMDKGDLETREGDELEHRAIYLDECRYNWALVRDSEGSLCLVPFKK